MLFWDIHGSLDCNLCLKKVPVIIALISTDSLPLPSSFPTTITSTLFFFLFYLLPSPLLVLTQSGNKQGNSNGALKHFADEMSGPLSPMPVPAQKQLRYTPGIVNGSVRDSAAFIDQTRKVYYLMLVCSDFKSLI